MDGPTTLLYTNQRAVIYFIYPRWR